jgi:hypothetical protein
MMTIPIHRIISLLWYGFRHLNKNNVTPASSAFMAAAYKATILMRHDKASTFFNLKVQNPPQSFI